MKQMNTDIIVVAAGLSGLAASIAAAENGVQVLVFEKSGTTGGAANMGMGPLGVGSRIQREQMISLTPGEAFRKHMYFTHYRVDARMVRDYYFKSGDTIDWLMDMGVEFTGVQRAFSAPEDTRAYSDGEFTWHVCKPEGGGVPGPRAATAMTKKMTERALELGVEFLYETPVFQILMEEGRAVGVLARAKDGEEIEARANAVIIATGGFGDNPQMIKEETGYEFGKTIFNFAIPGMKVVWRRMAWEAVPGKVQYGTDVSVAGQYEPLYFGRGIPSAMPVGKPQRRTLYAGRPDRKYDVYRKCHYSAAGKHCIFDI